MGNVVNNMLENVDSREIAENITDGVAHATQTVSEGVSGLVDRLSGFWKHKEVRILMLGLDSAGKSTISRNLSRSAPFERSPTIGFDVHALTYKNIKINIWDVGGQDKVRALWYHYYAGAHAVIFVVDSNDRQRIRDARDELHKVMAAPELQDAVFLVFANKQDLPRAMPVDKMTEKLQLHHASGRQKWHIQGASAMKGQGLDLGFDWVISNLTQKLESTAPPSVAGYFWSWFPSGYTAI
ncbi:ADP-ribosylation factor 1 [Diplonema papillatum]|nr:ADP-ribosylation factor 1 [Diplonema papillatum]